MDPFTMAAIMGGVGLLQGKQQDERARQQMKLNSMQQRFAPLFGQAPGAPETAQDGNAIKGGLAGALGGLQTGLNYEMMKNAMAQAGPQLLGQSDVAMNLRNQNVNPYGMKTGGQTYA